METTHRFRFGTQIAREVGQSDAIETARRVEALGYSTFLVPDHLGRNRLDPIVAMTLAAEATTTLRVGSLVLNNDLRHPVVLAHAAASLDVISGGRLELGIGAGWSRDEYTQAGIRFDSGPVRISRLAESLDILKAYFTRETVTFSGEHYSVSDLPALPRTVQSPHPPLHLGGGGKRVLSVAGRLADIVGLHVTSLPNGPDWTTATHEAMEGKLAWLREAAGERFPRLELSQIVFNVTVTDDRREAARRAAQRFGMTEEQALASPYLLIGSVEQICDDLRARRERYGISYIVVPEVFLEPFAPVVTRLAGQ